MISGVLYGFGLVIWAIFKCIYFCFKGFVVIGISFALHRLFDTVAYRASRSRSASFEIMLTAFLCVFLYKFTLGWYSLCLTAGF